MLPYLLLNTKSPKIGQNSIKSPFFARRAKRASAEGRSPPQELEVGPRSGPYLLVLLKGQSQCTWISFTCSTELKSSSPLIAPRNCIVCHLLTKRASWSRAPENLKLAGNWPKVAAMCGLQDYRKSHICVVLKLIIPITVVFMHLFWAFRPPSFWSPVLKTKPN